MKLKTIFFCIVFLFSSVYIQAQTKQDTSTLTIETKGGGIYTGQFISENSDTIKIKTENFGIMAIAKSEIVLDNLVSIETEDGNEFLGQIVKEDATSIVLKTQKLGEITIHKKDIKTQQEVDVQQIKEGKYWFANPQSTRYFWSPNGYGLKKGEGYYQNIWVLWNQFSYGITDNISIGGGVIPIFLFGAPTPVFGTLKFSIPIQKDKINVAGGAIFGGAIGEENTGVGIFYGLTTFGSPDYNVTFGMGYGYAAGEWASAPMINVNGMFRVSSRGYIITENYYINAGGEGAIFLSVGGRSIIKKAALDYGLIIPVVEGGAGFVLPWLGFTIPFGNTKQ